MTDYQRVAQAITFLEANFQEQPSLEEIAAQVHLSPFHFQRLFTSFAGVSPKKFLQYLSLNFAKNLLANPRLPLTEVAYYTGLSGSSRLHDLFIHIEAMTPGEYRQGGIDLTIKYHFADSLLGKVLLASTDKGLCSVEFVQGNEKEALIEIQQKWQNARWIEIATEFHHQALEHLWPGASSAGKLRLHLKGTPFQIKVWEALLRIPESEVRTYGDIANEIQQPAAMRAVGTAIGNNPTAFLIPCHRVIRKNGDLGGYHWGLNRKKLLLGLETIEKEVVDISE
jgi:AraC family transcriptional regulator of adaptative response/methylated-DNA-[protein]-cysteine methyltransferase